MLGAVQLVARAVCAENTPPALAVQRWVMPVVVWESDARKRRGARVVDDGRVGCQSNREGVHGDRYGVGA